MATRLTRHRCNTQRTLYNLWRRHHTVSDPLAPPFLRNQKLQQQYKEYSRSPPSFYRKAKDLVSPPLSSSGKWASKFGLVSWYLRMINSRPVVTKTITCSVIMTAADVTSQSISSEKSYDLVRTLRMAGYGMLILGPTLHYWFNFVSRILPNRDLISTLKKMALGQAVYGPCMNVIFFSGNAALEGERGEEIIARLKRDVVPTMINGAMYWPLCDFVTFKFVPVHLQPLVSNSFSYLWNVYLTYMASLEKVGGA